MKDYRLVDERAKLMEPRDIVEEVVFSISQDAPMESEDAEMSAFLLGLNPVVAAVYCAWISAGFMANGGLYHLYETCCAEMIQRSAYGFRLLGKTDVAAAIELSCRAFPRCVIPLSQSARRAALDEWTDREEANTETLEQQSLSGLEYTFDLKDTYELTAPLIQMYRIEFVQDSNRCPAPNGMSKLS